MGYNGAVGDMLGWGRVKNELPKGFRWECQGAKRRYRKGKAIGRMVMGIREGLVVRREEKEEVEGIMVKKVRMEREWWRVIGIYVNGDMEENKLWGGALGLEREEKNRGIAGEVPEMGIEDRKMDASIHGERRNAEKINEEQSENKRRLGEGRRDSKKVLDGDEG
ncbi:hypothetical protein EAI_05407 [Harpegnathos saltator]|uniref:Uncharacterized protein n=1 Tax=Harpegnathos saltator TaxID=610380 RepID=E2BRW2_HARSA|nr:hypothetical protein EAI_05407 [Harpegnathos saltator]